MAKVTIGEREYEVEVRGDTVVVDGHEYLVAQREEGDAVVVSAGGVPYRVALPPEGERSEQIMVQVDYRPFTVEIEGTISGGRSSRPAPREGRAAALDASGGIRAPMAGTIVSLNVKVGDVVQAGEVLMLMEAMKMENEIKSPAEGTVKELPVEPGMKVGEGQVLAVVE